MSSIAYMFKHVKRIQTKSLLFSNPLDINGNAYYNKYKTKSPIQNRLWLIYRERAGIVDGLAKTALLCGFDEFYT